MNDKTTIELCALWENKTKDGKTYLSGNLGNNKVLVFKNTHKKNEKEPDYRVLLAKKEQQAPAPSPRLPSMRDDDDDMPF